MGPEGNEEKRGWGKEEDFFWVKEGSNKSEVQRERSSSGSKDSSLTAHRPKK